MKSMIDSLQAMTEWQQISVGVAVVSRMYPNYALFAELTGEGDRQLFKNIVNLCWEYASGENLKIDFDKQQLKLAPVTPDPQRYDMYGVWPAMDAAVALTSLLSACDRFDSSEITALLQLSETTINGYLEASQYPGDFVSHELRRADTCYVNELLKLLASTDSGRKQTVKELRAWVNQWDQSNIGLELTA